MPRRHYEKAFDTVEHFAIFEAFRRTSINETYVKSLQSIYSQATARIHLNNLSDEFPINRGVRQGDPLSPKLLSAVMEEVADISKGINVDGKKTLQAYVLLTMLLLLMKKKKQLNKRKNI